MPTLYQQWRTLWREVGGNVTGMDTCFDDLMSRYKGPRRFYHTLSHVEDMLAEFETFRASDEFRIVDANVVEMGIWYHDAVYYPGAENNEERSANLFRTVGECSGFAPAFVQKVIIAILSTKHAEHLNDADVRTLCDLDLAILGQPEERFDRYEKQIREEYTQVPDNQFRKGRTAILKLFLARPSIYATKFFWNKYEDQAQENLKRSIRRLRNAA
jgi:predicted metal-dependent HD superfamily phosphohydrolase